MDNFIYRDPYPYANDFCAWSTEIETELSRTDILDEIWEELDSHNVGGEMYQVNYISVQVK